MLKRRGADASSLDYVASPLLRTRDTMELLRGAMGLEPGAYRTDDRLKELAFGEWEGFTWQELKARDRIAVRERKRDKWAFVPPTGGESYAQLGERLIPWIGTIRQHEVVVAHGGVARVLMVLLAGVSRETAPEIDIWQGRVMTFSGGRCHWD